MCCSLECIHNMFHLLNEIYLQIPTCNPQREPFPRFLVTIFFSGFSKSPSCHLTGTTVDDSEILQLSWHANSPISAICFTEISSGEPPIFWNINSVMNFRWSKFPNTKSSKNSKMIIFQNWVFKSINQNFQKCPKPKGSEKTLVASYADCTGHWSTMTTWNLLK